MFAPKENGKTNKEKEEYVDFFNKIKMKVLPLSVKEDIITKRKEVPKVLAINKIFL